MNRFEEERARDGKEMRNTFKRKLDEYGVSEDDKKELLTLSAHMSGID
ncbi:MAG: hypothetical protein AABX74_06580 [Nanoarchaeota archaeon]